MPTSSFRALLPLLLAASAVAQAPPTAAQVTEPGRSITRPLDVVLGGGDREAERTVVLLVDPAKALADAGIVDALTKALQQNRERMARTKLGLCVVGQKGGLAVPPTAEHDKVVAALRDALAKPAGEFVDLYADARAAIGAFGPGDGERVLLLVSLDNGDVESDVDGVARDLQRAKVRCEALTSEATLADCYWAARPYQDKPRGTTLTGADGAVIDVPWGWLFQFGSANETTPAGFAMWGITRLAAATGGRVFLYAAATQTQHQCSIHSRCLFCTGDHLHPDDAWSEPLVDMLAPPSLSRGDTHAALGGDPCFRAMLDAWRQASEAGLVSSSPGVKLTTAGAEPERARPGRDLDLTDGAAFERQARRAEEAAAKAQQIGAQLQTRLDGIEAGKARPRCDAAARYTRVMLQVTRVNLLTYAAWCRDVAPTLFGKEAAIPLPPETASVEREDRPVGVGVSTLGLCHGVAPFYAVELPGMPGLRTELEALDRMFVAYQQRYGKSQFGLLLRRNGIAQFWPTFPGNSTPPPRQRPKSASDANGPITPRRPARAGGSSGGGSSGPTTGGGR